MTAALSRIVEGDGAEMFGHACALGLEGIVSKRLTAPYKSGPCKSWIKVRKQGRRHIYALSTAAANKKAPRECGANQSVRTLLAASV